MNTNTQKKHRLDKRKRVAWRRQVKDHFAERAEAATLLGHLQGVGAIAYSHGGRVTNESFQRSLLWILNRFAEPTRGEDGSETVSPAQAVQAAVARWEKLTGRVGEEK